MTKEEELRRHAKNNPHDPDEWFSLGYYLYREGRMNEAENVLQYVGNLRKHCDSYRKALTLLQEIQIRLGPSRNQELAILVKDEHKQFKWLFEYAGQCHSWFRREVPGVYDLAQYLRTEESFSFPGHYRVAAIVICVFSHDFKAAKAKLEELVEEQNVSQKWKTYIELREAGEYLPRHVEVYLWPKYELDEYDRFVAEKAISEMPQEEAVGGVE
ncbi:MAG: hypothetical protein ACXADD_13790 [Candidatus Thorarchaeota archaeon]